MQEVDRQLVNQVWEGLLESERLNRYYGRMAERFGRRHLWAMWSIALLSSGAVGTLLASLQSWVPLTLAALTAALALWASYNDYSRKGALAAAIAGQCMDLVQEWERLWRRGLYSEDTPARVDELAQKINRITAPALHAHGFVDDKLNKRCSREANEHWQVALTN